MDAHNVSDSSSSSSRPHPPAPPATRLYQDPHPPLKTRREISRQELIGRIRVLIGDGLLRTAIRRFRNG
ncbi:hypothetical protein QJS10_CPB19g01713 [Acorus calamus]|uniref:RST domain-containing protein n=1 Tax=Acorus calamus TaxID=4465 RepID=A0AAV9CIE2_ACOCL|nr:hypothetical protein QJS10_CPB19g01713 [Acorus calamus]